MNVVSLSLIIFRHWPKHFKLRAWEAADVQSLKFTSNARRNYWLSLGNTQCRLIDIYLENSIIRRCGARLIEQRKTKTKTKKNENYYACVRLVSRLIEIDVMHSKKIDDFNCVPFAINLMFHNIDKAFNEPNSKPTTDHRLSDTKNKTHIK